MLCAFVVVGFLSILLPTSFAQFDSTCCPPAGPSGTYLQLEQFSPSQKTLCDYGTGPVYVQCPYGPALIENIPGCPSSLRVDPFEGPVCPFRSPIHPVGHSSKCVDVGKGFKVGSQAQIDDCDGQDKQRFLYKQGVTNIRVAGTNFCLWAGQTPVSGSKVVLGTCDENELLQRWDYSGGNQFGLDGTGLSLHLPGGNVANGAVQLEVRPFDQTVPLEEWQWTTF